MESKLAMSNAEQPPLESFEQLCDICKEENTIQAVGYCQQCNQYLCKLCSDQHGRIVGTKHHTVRCKDETVVFGRETLFGRKLIPSSVIVVPQLPSLELSSTPQVKYVNFFRDIDKMVVLCWYPSNNIYAIFEFKEDQQERYSIILVKDIDICLDMKSNQILVYIQKNNVVAELDISQPLLSKKELFKTSGECRALVEFDDGFAAAIKMSTAYDVPEWQIQYMGRDGKLKNRISYDKDENALVASIKALASNHTQNTLYVLDDTKRNLLGFNIAGEILFTFTHANMEAPRSLVVDREGNIYVACKNKILQVNMDGTKHVVVMNNKCNETTLVAYNSTKEMLVVGNETERLQCFMFV